MQLQTHVFILISLIAFALTALVSIGVWRWRTNMTDKLPTSYYWYDFNGDLRVDAKPYLNHILDCGLLYPGLYGNMWFFALVAVKQFA